MKKIVVSILLVSFAFVVSAQADKKQDNINSNQKTVISKDKNNYTVQVKDTATAAKIVPGDTSRTNKQIQFNNTKNPVQTGKLQNQKPTVADTSAINKQAPAYKAKKVVLSNQKDPVMK
jgi:hypothetical protein